VIPDVMAREVGWVQQIETAPYFAHAQFSDPVTVLSLPDPGASLPYVQAMWHYARGTAYAAQGDSSGAARESESILALEQNADFTALEAGGVPARQVLRVARHVVDARTAQSRGDLAQAVAELDLAVALEDQLAYMEPPFWYYPLRQSRGAAKLLAGDTTGAETDFRAILVATPQNGWALYGLAEVFRQQGDARSARAIEKRLREAWIGDPSRLSLARL
jgi:hypothetical protein